MSVNPWRDTTHDGRKQGVKGCYGEITRDPGPRESPASARWKGSDVQRVHNGLRVRFNIGVSVGVRFWGLRLKLWFVFRVIGLDSRL